MRKLAYFTLASLDGFIEDPSGSLDWSMVDEELHTYMNALEQDVGLYLYGRRMYELMQSYWPTAEEQSPHEFERAFSRIWKQIPKLVFSRTLHRVEGNATLVHDDPVDVVRKLKAQAGGDIEVGGADLAGQLVKAGLVDAYRLFINPVILGGGKRMLPALDGAIPLRLAEMHRFSSGVVFLRYQAAT